MVSDSGTGGLTAQQLRSARQYLRQVARDLARNAAGVAREQAVELAAVGLESIPVPILNRTLAETVRRTFGKRKDGRPADVEGLMQVLEEMQESDDGFQRGLDQLSLDLESISRDLAAVKQLLTDRAVTDFRIINPTLDLEWPVGDNTVTALLANVGGGTVIVHEIHLDIEDWEPCTDADYSVPAAPLQVLHLQAELTVERDNYPLLALNEAEERIFNERSAGAERVVIDLTSKENATYAARLRLAYTELETGNAGETFYPAPGQTPLTLPFNFAPGWRRIEPESVLGRDEIIDRLNESFTAITGQVRDRPHGPDHFEELAAAVQVHLAVAPWMFDIGLVDRILANALTTCATLSAFDKRADSLAVIDSVRQLLTAYMGDRYSEDLLPPAFEESIAVLAQASNDA